MGIKRSFESKFSQCLWEKGCYSYGIRHGEFSHLNQSAGKMAKMNIYALSLVWPVRQGTHKTDPWGQETGHVALMLFPVLFLWFLSKIQRGCNKIKFPLSKMKDFYARGLLLCDYWFFRFCTLFLLVKKHEVEGKRLSVPAALPLGEAIQWASREQYRIPTIVLPTWRACLPSLENSQTGTPHRDVCSWKTEWFRDLNPWWFIFLDSLRNPIMLGKPTNYRIKDSDEGDLIERVWVMLFKWKFWIILICLCHPPGKNIMWISPEKVTLFVLILRLIISVCSFDFSAMRPNTTFLAECFGI